MTDDAPSTAGKPPPEPTDVRFKLRSLLVWTIVVALGAAALGPYFRGLDPSVRPSVGLLWGVCVAFSAFWIGHAAWTRYHLERTAGANLLELVRAQRHFGGNAHWLAYVSGAVLLGVGVAYLLLLSYMFQDDQDALVPLLFFVLICSRVITQGVATIWWTRTVQLRDEGVLYGLRLLRWDHVTDCRFSRWSGILSFEGVDQRHRDIRVDAALPADRLTTAEAILADKLARLLGSQNVAIESGTSAPSLFPLTTGRDAIRFGCLVGITGYIVGIFVVAQIWFGQNAAFKFGCLAGLAVGVVATGYGERQIRKAGPPRVRLPVQFDWPMLSARLTIAAILFYMGRWTSTALPLAAGVAGLGCGLALYASVGSVAQFHVDLCDQGVKVGRWAFWPWESLRVRRPAGRVSFHRRWSRVVARVPWAQREAVDRLLAEKLDGDRAQSGMAST